MARAQEFKYTITAEVSFPTKIGVKELKKLAKDELGFICAGDSSVVLVGKVTVVAVK